jgi:hypothetical protein
MRHVYVNVNADEGPFYLSVEVPVAPQAVSGLRFRITMVPTDP